MITLKVPRILAFIVTIAVFFMFLCPVLVSFSTSEFDIQENTQHWATDTFSSLIGNGVIKDGEFPLSEYDKPITRGVFVEVLMRLFPDENEHDGTSQVFTDIPIWSDYYDATEQAKRKNIVLGFPDGSFRPDEHIRREDLFSILGRAIENSAIELEPTTTNNKENVIFVDDSSISDYARTYVYELLAYSIIVGYTDGTIRPGNEITHAEALTIIERIRKDITVANKDTVNNAKSITDPPLDTQVIQEDTGSNEAINDTNSNGSENSAGGGVGSADIGASSPGGGSKNSGGGSNNSGSSSKNSGGGSKNSGGGNSSNPGSSDKTQPAPTEVYEFDDSTPANIDSLISLKNVKSITVSRELYDSGFFKPITLIKTEDKKTVIDALRNLKIRTIEKLHLGTTGYEGGYTLSMQYVNGSSKELYIYDCIQIENEDGHYPILWVNESNDFKKILGKVILSNYRQMGLRFIIGTWDECIEKNEFGETWRLNLYNGSTSLYRFDYNISSTVDACAPHINVEHSEVEVYFSERNNSVAERVFIIGPEDNNPEPTSLRYKLSQAMDWQMRTADNTDVLPLIWELQESRMFLEDLFGYGTDRAIISNPIKVRRLLDHSFTDADTNAGTDNTRGFQLSEKISDDNYYFITVITNNYDTEGIPISRYGGSLRKTGQIGEWQFYVDNDLESTFDILTAYNAILMFDTYNNTYLDDCFSSLGVIEIDDIRYIDIGKPEGLILAYFLTNEGEYGCLLNMSAELANQTGLVNQIIYPIREIISKLK